MFILNDLYTLMFIVNVGLAMVVIFLERRNIGVTWAWLMVLLFLPAAGFILYLIFGQNLSKMKLYKINKRSRQIMSGLISSQQRQLAKDEIEFKDPSMADYRDMIYMNLTSSSAYYTQNNKVHIFTDGKQKFDSLLETMEAATDHIHLMYYIVQNDSLGKQIVEVLTRKAAEGVQVRFLYDRLGSHRISNKFFQSLIAAGGQAAAFFPSRIPYLNFRVNYRNHRKLAIIDGKFGYIGGFNIGQEYLGMDRRFGYWRDTHLLIQGNAVGQMQAQFLLDWNLASKKESDLIVSSSLFSAMSDQDGMGVQIVASGPNYPIEHIRNVYIKLISSAKESVYIQTPYFVPDESLLTALKMAVLSGVDVRLMIPANPDHKMVYWASYSYLGELLSIGMRCYLYEKGFLHAKTIVTDGKLASVGTANMDNRSFRLNFEVIAMLYDTGTAGRLRDIFQEDMKHSRELTYADYQARPRLHKIRESCTRLLSPIL
ncbi:cardiolipin synthase [Paenibacillus sp. y28]|uniref:cardiolipin synthase n=1 Tax=Paenibacillus sp. y28 TaxID=3129110 RepID=UPI0030171A40